MEKNIFRFRRFDIRQDLCAMKVGTDGVLLGAWARVGGSVLDVGTGTGIIALMAAQRGAQSVCAIDVDADACRQASENVAASPFASAIVVENIPLQDYPASAFDAVVSNPPYFSNSLLSPDAKRSVARHTRTLSFADLCRHAARLLADDGEFSVVVPFDYRSAMDMEASFVGLFPSRVCGVRTTPVKPVRRYLLAYRLSPSAHVEQSELVIGSEEYKTMVEDFYLKV